MNGNTALWWTTLNLISMFVLGFYSMQEMASVSFNKIRLHYYVSKGMKRAIWLNDLLQDPARLFGTTLLSVNAAMFIGSECARQTYIALGLSPDIAPLTQVLFVILFAELAPMFAARRYPEQVALFGAPILYFSAMLMTPLLWAVSAISTVVDKLAGSKESQKNHLLNQEDLQKILSKQKEEGTEEEPDEFDLLARNVFSLRAKDARLIIEPLTSFPALPVHATISQMRPLLAQSDAQDILVYRYDIQHVVGVVSPRNLLRVPETHPIHAYMTPPWFITRQTKLMKLLHEFRQSNQRLAIVLNEHGLAVGMIKREDLLQELFGKIDLFTEAQRQPPSKFLIDRTFPADLSIGEFNKEFGVTLSSETEKTLAELMTHLLGHPPHEGESVSLPPFELTVVESSLLEATRIAITTRVR